MKTTSIQHNYGSLDDAIVAVDSTVEADYICQVRRRTSVDIGNVSKGQCIITTDKDEMSKVFLC